MFYFVIAKRTWEQGCVCFQDNVCHWDKCRISEKLIIMCFFLHHCVLFEEIKLFVHLSGWLSPCGRIQAAFIIFLSCWSKHDAVQPSVILISDIEKESEGISCWWCKHIHPACGSFGDTLFTKCSTRLLSEYSVMDLQSFVTLQKKDFKSSANLGSVKLSFDKHYIIIYYFLLNFTSDYFPRSLTTKWTISPLQCEV